MRGAGPALHLGIAERRTRTWGKPRHPGRAVAGELGSRCCGYVAFKTGQFRGHVLACLSFPAPGER